VCAWSLIYPSRTAHAPYIVIWDLPRSALFFHVSHKRHYFRKKNVIEPKCVFLFLLQLLSETFLFLRKNERDTIKMSSGLHVKYRLFLSDLNEPWIFSTVFRKILKYPISLKSVQWEPSFPTRTDGRTDEHMTKLTAFSQFWERV
jgi:hypothetical protein